MRGYNIPDDPVSARKPEEAILRTQNIIKQAS